MKWLLAFVLVFGFLGCAPKKKIVKEEKIEEPKNGDDLPDWSKFYKETD